MIKGNHIGSSLQRLLSERKKGRDKLAIKSYRELIPRGGGGVLPYMGYIGMCRCEEYGFQAVYSRIGCINQSVWV